MDEDWQGGYRVASFLSDEADDPYGEIYSFIEDKYGHIVASLAGNISTTGVRYVNKELVAGSERFIIFDPRIGKAHSSFKGVKEGDGKIVQQRRKESRDF